MKKTALFYAPHSSRMITRQRFRLLHFSAPLPAARSAQKVNDEPKKIFNLLIFVYFF